MKVSHHYTILAMAATAFAQGDTARKFHIRGLAKERRAQPQQICHCSPTADCITLGISYIPIQEHLDHGDAEGPCACEAPGGTEITSRCGSIALEGIPGVMQREVMKTFVKENILDYAVSSVSDVPIEYFDPTTANQDAIIDDFLEIFL
ncbi:expressed unknown protein [Seminavis robusta]|uniref:Uncharacterized protein n=1 Tax=Seminavis robusta TaxID=568900 RepID=A0A9N8EHI3_9STRA|nr:expressed unknown protein [Seminavis robusta]|eukprot:Sro1199_g251730.1 n/a (149) ;mRNA; r:12528-13062